MVITRGIDISRYQDRTPTTDPSDDPDWTKVAAAGYGFGLCRMAKAGQSPDETGRRELAKMLRAMPVSGAYGVVGTVDPVADATFFLSEVAAVTDPRTVLLMLDAEDIRLRDGTIIHPTIQQVDAYARVVHDKVGRWPAAYCPGWWMGKYGYSAAGLGLANCPWAQSHYYPGPWTDDYLLSKKPTLAYGFKALAWLQFTSSATVPGFTDPVDVNAFYGSLDELKVALLGVMPIPEVDDVPLTEADAKLLSDYLARKDAAARLAWRADMAALGTQALRSEGVSGAAGYAKQATAVATSIIDKVQNVEGNLGANIDSTRSAVLGALAALPPPADVDEAAVADQVVAAIQAKGVQVNPDALLEALRLHPLAPAP